MHQMARQQEVDLMLATPHFYASQDRIDNFLKRREEAWVQFHDTVEASEETEPRIILGAEVAFFDGISRVDGKTTLPKGGAGCLFSFGKRVLREKTAVCRSFGGMNKKALSW